MDFVVLPAEALCDSNTSPLGFAKNTQHATIIRLKVAFWDQLQERLRQDNMPEPKQACMSDSDHTT